MCVRQVLVKSISPNAPKISFVPCGRCEECRDSKKYQWQFRLRAELDFCRKQCWNIGFFTLTYADEHLPTIPDWAFKGNVPDKPIQCFNRIHLRNFIDNIRKRLHELYRVKSLRYMICSELGEMTQRSHYHGVISFPPECDPKKVFDLVHSQWKFGHVFPRYFDGGRDSHGYKHKPFLITGDTQGAAVYAAKYVCKDLNFYRQLTHFEFVDKDDPLYTYVKDMLPIHIQSRSIGKSYLSSVPTKDLLRLLREGESFVGVSKKVHLPLYIRNKILYTPKYLFVERTSPNQPVADWWYDFECDKWRFRKGEGTHFRQVTKEPTKFMLEHYVEIYRQKKEYYRQFFVDISRTDFWRNRGIIHGSDSLVQELRKIDHLDHFTDYFIAYYGVPKDNWFSVCPSRQWLLRYVPLRELPPAKHDDSFVFKNESKYDAIINKVCTRLRYLTSVDLQKRKRIAEIQDIHKHQV